jgi:nucleoside-diphosphate-sugar epimerase
MKLKDAKIVITGGVGLVGSNIARRLVALGCDVLLIDSLSENFGGNLHNISDIGDHLRLNISDIRDRHGLRFLLKDRDIMFNLAGQTSHLDSMEAPFEDLAINCTAQLGILETCRIVRPNIRIVFASTRQVYGRPQQVPVNEHHPVRPVDVNGINKAAGESYHLLYHAVHSMQTTVIRMTNTYGPGMRVKDARQIFLGAWVGQLLRGQSFEVWGGNQVRDFTYVGDAADAFLAAAISPNTVGKLYNLGGSDVMSIQGVAELLIEIAGTGRYDIMEFPFNRRPIDIGDYYTDDAQFRKATGWSPTTSLRAGLSLSLDYYRQNSQHYL